MVQVRVVIVNVMSGTLEYGHGTLTGPLAPTRVLGPVFLMQTERALCEGLEAGMDVSRTGDTLILFQGANTFFFVAQPDSAQQ
ncbi:hypothetical protein, conserved [Trypanosoma cruzi]|uniref:DUF306 domain-containing protein n=1 Tax=Trypanosoma cruzi (strain CL Brener) TaxID=353153 RepID=Q4D1E9_TRYCC|nr:hypothetical protein, conserved [Trypanosoma cruzi]EAN86354.1 hypothetical protein, conserved [Trypanosoma cruzi]|eukprot:XP_808205.1 hypothetical protein [Trypanosoma cruzi strain CL Brener]